MFSRVTPLLRNVLELPARTVTYCSTQKGKRKTVKAVIYRFLRLHSGLWLRRKVSPHTALEEKDGEPDMSMKGREPVHGLVFLQVDFIVFCLSTSLTGISMSVKRSESKWNIPDGPRLQCGTDAPLVCPRGTP